MTKRAMWRKVLYLVLAFLLCADLTYSFLQYLHQPLDGDMAWNIVPAEEVESILNDPLGLGAVVHGHTYPNPNRFFCHWIFRAYLGEVPLLLQGGVPQIDSVYLACAISKVLLQALLLFLLAAYATGHLDPRRLDVLGAAVLIAPLFQANGYRSYMGIIDPSTTYTFFYALPCAFLLLYFLPLFLHQCQGRVSEQGARGYWWWTIPMSFIVCLSGPLNPGAALVALVLLVGRPFIRTYQQGGGGVTVFLRSLPAAQVPFLVPVALLSMYSLHLGQYNSITINTSIPLADRFAQLPMGIYYQFTQKLGFPVLFALIGINLGIIARTDASVNGRRLVSMAKWIGAFALLYMLLLPFGGYREYRPHVLRYDTIMPITLALLFLFAASSLRILNGLSARRWWYPLLLLAGAVVFTVADEPSFDGDRCERAALEVIAASKEQVVALEQPCSVLDWEQRQDPKASELNARLLLKWRIIDREKLYFHATTP